MPVATLADLRGVTPWLWVICARALFRSMHGLWRKGRDDPNSWLGWTADAGARLAGGRHLGSKLLPPGSLPAGQRIASQQVHAVGEKVFSVAWRGVGPALGHMG